MDNRLLGNRYEILEEIGAGGMARVYKAKCMLLNRYVAVKILKDEFAKDPDFLRRFKNEAQSAAGLSHQNIISIYDVGSDGDDNYIIMEYVKGRTLKSYLEGKDNLPEKEVLEISIQVCRALIHAHSNGVIHRDIKPHNIIIQEDGTVKVADFGIARAVSSATVTTAGSTMGSVHYFSPEQARGLQTDAKSDLYSLGTTIYELITGRLVFDADTPVAVALKHVQEEPLPPAAINRTISLDLNSMIMRLLSKDPEDRYKDAGALLKDLEKLLRKPSAKLELPTDEFDSVHLQTEDNMFVRKRRKRKGIRDISTTIIAVLISAAAVVLFAYIVFGIIIPSLDLAMDEVREVTIGNYVGDKIENAAKILDDYRIEIIKDEIYDEDSKPGEILSQSVSPGSTLKEGAKITLTVSLGPEYISYRSFTYVDYREAERELRDMGLKPVIISEYHDEIENGFVIGTDPPSGTKVRLGTEIKIYRSLGKEILYVFVPDLVGMTYAEAMEEIDINNLELEMAVNYGKEGYTDIVSYQSPSKNVRVPEGTKITIFMEKETEPSESETTAETGSSDTGVTETTASETTTLEQDDFIFVEHKITLEEMTLPDSFGFAVETRTSQEDVFSTHFIGDIGKSDLPFIFILKIPKGGYTDIRIYVDTEFVSQYRITGLERE